MARAVVMADATTGATRGLASRVAVLDRVPAGHTAHRPPRKHRRSGAGRAARAIGSGRRRVAVERGRNDGIPGVARRAVSEIEAAGLAMRQATADGASRAVGAVHDGPAHATGVVVGNAALRRAKREPTDGLAGGSATEDAGSRLADLIGGASPAWLSTVVDGRIAPARAHRGVRRTARVRSRAAHPTRRARSAGIGTRDHLPAIV